MNFKTLLLYFILIVTLFNSYLLFFHKPGDLKIAYVDNMKVIQNYKGMNELKTEMEVSNKKYKETLDTIRLSFEKELKEYEKTRSKLSEKEKALTEQLLHHKQQQYGQYKESVEKKLKEQQVEITQKLLTKLDVYMKSYAKEKGYDFILGANSTANIIFAKETYDVTEDMITAANAQYSKHE